MTLKPWRLAGYRLGYRAGYQPCVCPQTNAPKAPPTNHAERDGYGNDALGRVVAERRSVPLAEIKTGVAGEGGATPVNRSRSPLTCIVNRVAVAARV